MLFASVFGAGATADAWNFAFRVPNFLRVFMSEGSLAASIVPTYTRERNKLGESAAGDLARVLYGTFGIAFVFLAFLLLVFAPAIVSGLAPGFAATPGKIDTTILLLRIMAFFFGLTGVISVYLVVLQARQRWVATAIAPAVFNISLIAGLAYLIASKHLENPDQAVRELAWFAVGATAVQGVIAIWTTMQDRAPVRWRLDFRHAGLHRVLILAAPTLATIGIVEARILVDTALAARLGEGMVSFMEYADRLNQLPYAVLAASLGTAAVPTLSALRQKRAEMEASNVVADGLVGQTLLMAPCACIFFVASDAIVSVVFGYGRFATPDNIRLTGNLLRAYAPLLPLAGAVRVLLAEYYSRHDTRSPFYFGTTGLIAKLVIAFAALPVVGVVALPISTVVGHATIASLLAFRVPGVQMRAQIASALSESLRLIAWAAVSGGLAWIGCDLYDRWVNPSTSLAWLGKIAVAATITLGAYATIVPRLLSPRRRRFANRLVQRLARFGR